jgi:ComF family protein
MRAAFDALLSVLVAAPCLACNAPLDAPSRGPVCAACWQAIRPLSPPLCRTCGDPLRTWRTLSALEMCTRCRRTAPPLDLARAVGHYDGALRAIVHAFKYDGRRSLARTLAALMREHSDGVLAGAGLAVPVPLHWWRRRRRGFNQAADLAQHLGLPVMDALRRSRATATQTHLPSAQRHRNVRGAFAPRRAARTVRGQIVVLVDDVSTTGATLAACARVLKASGAKEVRALTAARVVISR